jgi:hypothetical protein
MKWDLFICHASEDKESFVRPLVRELLTRHPDLHIWYDEFGLVVGDSLRAKIDYGLANSRFGVVILSPHFFAKKWPQRELDGLVAREEYRRKIILPVWHNITHDDLLRCSPLLADRVAARSADGLDVVVTKLMEAIRSSGSPTPDSPRAYRRPRRAVTLVGLAAVTTTLMVGVWFLWLRPTPGSSRAHHATTPATTSVTDTRPEVSPKTSLTEPAPEQKKTTRPEESTKAQRERERVSVASPGQLPGEPGPTLSVPKESPHPQTSGQSGWSGRQELRIDYQYNSLRICIGATAYLGKTRVGEATMTDLVKGKYYEVEETHYSPSGSGQIIYRARSRFSIPGGIKISEDRLYGLKVLQIFESWP